MEKISKINTEAWNNNELPEDLMKDCYELARYNPQSLNKEDQQDQKDLWIRMFERTKTYDQGMEAMYKWLRADAFIHDRNKTHKIMQFYKKLL